MHAKESQAAAESTSSSASTNGKEDKATVKKGATEEEKEEGAADDEEDRDSSEDEALKNDPRAMRASRGVLVGEMEAAEVGAVVTEFQEVRESWYSTGLRSYFKDGGFGAPNC